METFVLYALISVFLFALSSVITKFFIVKAGGPVNFLLFHLSIGMIVMSLIFTFYVVNGYDYSILFQLEYLIPIIISSTFAFLGFISLLLGFEKGNASVGGVILSSRVFASVPMAYFFIGEVFGIEIYLFILLALVGAIINSWRKGMDIKGLATLKADGMRWFMLTAIFWAGSNFMIRYIGDAIPALVFMFSRQIIMLILIVITYIVLTRKFNRPRAKRQNTLLYQIFLYVVLLVFAQVGMITALSQSLTITEAIGVLEGSITLIISVLYGKFVDNKILDEALDRKSLAIRIFGALVALLGTLGVVLSIS